MIINLQHSTCDDAFTEIPVPLNPLSQFSLLVGVVSRIDKPCPVYIFWVSFYVGATPTFPMGGHQGQIQQGSFKFCLNPLSGKP